MVVSCSGAFAHSGCAVDNSRVDVVVDDISAEGVVYSEGTEEMLRAGVGSSIRVRMV